MNFYNNALIQLKATDGNAQVSLKWSPVEEADGYIVTYGTEPGKYTETVRATKDKYGNFDIPGLTNGTKYYFVVKAISDGTELKSSNEASATPQGQSFNQKSHQVTEQSLL